MVSEEKTKFIDKIEGEILSLNPKNKKEATKLVREICFRNNISQSYLHNYYKLKKAVNLLDIKIAKNVVEAYKKYGTCKNASKYLGMSALTTRLWFRKALALGLVDSSVNISKKMTGSEEKIKAFLNIKERFYSIHKKVEEFKEDLKNKSYSEVKKKYGSKIQLYMDIIKHG